MNKSIHTSGQRADKKHSFKRLALIGTVASLLALGGCAIVPTPYGPAVVPAGPVVVGPGYGYGGPAYGPGYGGAVVVRPYGRPYGHRHYR